MTDPSFDALGRSRDLDFFRNKRTGKVHVELPDDMVDGRAPSSEASAAVWGLIPSLRSLCGLTVINSDVGHGSGTRVSHFNDEDTCAACVRLLPDPSKAFEHPQEGDEDD